MKRTPATHLPALTAITVLLTGTALATGTVPAHADTPTCDGKPATIVGPGPNNVIEGTPGDDVIITVAEVAIGSNGGINTYEGDDTVCIVPGTAAVPNWETFNAFTIRTGPGNDKVFNQEPRNTSDLVVVLGLGADTFVGNDRNDRIWAGETKVLPDGPWWNMSDDAQDIITTAGGMDFIHTGTAGTPNTDIISSGAGYDEITQAGTGTTIDNGDGPDGGDRLTIVGHGWKQALLTIDNRTHTATGDTGEVLRWTNVNVFHVMAESPLRYIGADTRDILYVGSALPPGQRTSVPVDVSMNGGDDYFWFYNGIAPGRVDGGEGADIFEPEDRDPCLDATSTFNKSYTCTIDLPGDNLTYRVALAGFETYNPFYASRSATIIGSAGADTIRVYAPTATVRGLQGNDHIYADADHPIRAYLRGDQGSDLLVGGDGRDKLLGGRGNDKIRGGAGRDRLLGGIGHDKAKGSTGRDTCRAEVTRSCER